MERRAWGTEDRNSAFIRDTVHETGGFHVVVRKLQFKGSKLPAFQTDHIRRDHLFVPLFISSDLRPDAAPYCASSVKSDAVHAQKEMEKCSGD